MSIKEKTKKIPKLRFKEFSGEWEEKSLKQIGEIIGGGTPETNKPLYWDGAIPWLTPTEVKNKYVSKSQRTITKDGLSNSSAKLLPEGTIIFTSRATVGDVAISKIELTTNQGFQSVIVNSLNFNEFIYYWLKNNKKLFLRKASGSTFPEISRIEMLKIKGHFPLLTEQQKIASFLTVVDEKIEKLEEKKVKFEKYKKGVMQAIFSQKIRFKREDGSEFPGWEEKKLGELCKIRTGKLDANAMVQNGRYRFYTCAKEYYQIDDYAFDTEALLVSGNGANVGYIHYYKGKFNAYQRTYVLDQFNEKINFIKYALDKDLSKRIDVEKKDGNTPYIVLETLSKMPVKLPSVKEQEKIAEFLTSLDNKIELINKELEKAKEFKKGLLQEMFV